MKTITTFMMLAIVFCFYGCRETQPAEDSFSTHIEQQIRQRILADPNSIKGMSANHDYAGYENRQLTVDEIATLEKGMDLKSVLDLCGRPMASLEVENDRLLVFCTSAPSTNSELRHSSFPIMIAQGSVQYLGWDEVDTNVVLDDSAERLIALLKKVPLCQN